MYEVDIEIKVFSNQGNQYTAIFKEEIEARTELIESYYGCNLEEANQADIDRGIKEKFQKIIQNDDYLILADEQLCDELGEDELIIGFVDNLPKIEKY